MNTVELYFETMAFLLPQTWLKNNYATDVSVEDKHKPLRQIQYLAREEQHTIR